MSFTWLEFPKKAWMLIFTQTFVIVFLSSWLFEEYLNNPFMQQYVSNVAPTVVPVLSVTFGAVAAMTATTLYIRVRRSRIEAQDMGLRPPQGIPRRTAAPRKRTPKATIVKAKTDLPGGLPSPTFVITESKPEPAPAEAPSQQSTPAAQTAPQQEQPATSPAAQSSPPPEKAASPSEQAPAPSTSTEQPPQSVPVNSQPAQESPQAPVATTTPAQQAPAPPPAEQQAQLLPESTARSEVKQGQ